MGKTIKRRERKSKCGRSRKGRSRKGRSRKGRSRKGRAAGRSRAGSPVKAKRLIFKPGENYKVVYPHGPCETVEGSYLDGVESALIAARVQAVIRCKTGEVVFGALPAAAA